MCSYIDCVIPNALALAESFSKMQEDESIAAVRTLLLVLTAPPYSENTVPPSKILTRFRENDCAGLEQREIVCRLTQ